MRPMAKKTLLVAAAVGLLSPALAAPAMALVSEYGSYAKSYDDRDRGRVYACDEYQDGNGVYAKWKAAPEANADEVRNSQGAGTCSTAYSERGVYGHQIWVDLRFRPDPHGPFVHY